MSLERPFFQSFVEGDGEAFDRYISEKRRDGSWGDEPEIQALCELYDRPCEVWAYDAGMDPRKGGGARILRTFHAAAKGGSVMRLSYYGGGHYDSLVNDSDEFDPLADPGSCELLALQKARARKTNADASSALAVSDAEATERAAVEQALSASRAAYDGAADLEAALFVPACARGTGRHTQTYWGVGRGVCGRFRSKLMCAVLLEYRSRGSVLCGHEMQS